MDTPASPEFDAPVDRARTCSLKWNRYAGRDILPLWVADMDFKSPQPVLDALARRLDHGVFGYSVPDADVETAVTEYLRREHGASDAHPSWLIWFPGLVPALNILCRAFGEEGDAVMTATPVYPPFLSAPPNARRHLAAVPLRRAAGRWTFDIDAMERAITPRTRMFILCNPHNPVGRVFDADELRSVAEFCARHDLVLVSDEIHCDLILEPGLRHISALADLSRGADHLVTLFAPSKTYNTPGLACAFAAVPDPALRARVKEAARGVITEINAFGLAGCAAAYREGEPWRQRLIAYLRANRDTVAEHVRARLPGLAMGPVEATYLAWIDARGMGEPRPAKAFETAGVGLSDGTAFGPGGEGWVRLNFGCPRATLLEALARMARATAG